MSMSSLQPAPVAVGVTAGDEVFFDGEVFEHPAAFHHLEDSPPHQLFRIEGVDALPLEVDLAVGDLSVFRFEQTRNRFQGRCLAGAVVSQDGDDLALVHGQRHALQHQDDVVVDHFDVVDAQAGVPPVLLSAV